MPHVLLAIAASRSAQAQFLAGPVPPGADDQFVRDLKEGRKKGVGVVLLSATESAFLPCDAAEIVSGKSPPIRLTSSYALGDDVHEVPAGDYVLLRVRCDRSITEGPHAKFHVGAGEVVNVGSLRMDKTVNGLSGLLNSQDRVKRSIADTPPGLMNRVTSRYPHTMALAVKHPMTLVGPPEGVFQVKPNGL